MTLGSEGRPYWSVIAETFGDPEDIKIARDIWDQFAHVELDERLSVTLWSVAVFRLAAKLREFNLKIVANGEPQV
jgi:hypothetical protein